MSIITKKEDQELAIEIEHLVNKLSLHLIEADARGINVHVHLRHRTGTSSVTNVSFSVIELKLLEINQNKVYFTHKRRNDSNS